ncbi:MAG: hypothetical protein KBD50_02470 [Candidatus Pacebacteria bacterium]|nr:hypothetical protein [Candidatus Paceibacterota bacterium]
MKKDFTKLALQSILFKGHRNWYFSYLKIEKLAHVLLLLKQKTVSPSPLFNNTVEQATRAPEILLSTISGDVADERCLAYIFAIISQLRLLTTSGEIGRENAAILVQEFEQIIERVVEAGQGFSAAIISSEHLSVAFSAEEEYPQSLPVPTGFPAQPIKDIYKGQYKGHKTEEVSAIKGQESSEGRITKILEIVRKNKGISIKGISTFVRDCSEKTIQRELGTLIEQGLVVREGERRWSIYRATSTS